MVRRGGGYEPAGTPPSGYSAHMAALWRAADAAHRQRPSVRNKRLQARWAAQLLHIEKNFGARDFQGQRFDHAAFQGYSFYQRDPRKTDLGNMRKTVHPLTQLAAIVRARDAGTILPGATCTTSSAALRARLARRYASFSRGGT